MKLIAEFGINWKLNAFPEFKKVKRTVVLNKQGESGVIIDAKDKDKAPIYNYDKLKGSGFHHKQIVESKTFDEGEV